MRRNGSKAILRWIDAVPVLHLASLAVATILMFAFCYWRWGGLRPSGPNGVGFPDSLYFSVVTFSSLGYGDFVPVGFAKPLACCEVMLGLAFVGIGIAKLSSASQSYLLGQLYAREAQDRYARYLLELREVREEYSAVQRMLRQGTALPFALGHYHLKAQKVLARIRDYSSFEINQGDLLRRMPIGPIAHVLRTCSQMMPLLSAVSNQRRSLHSQKQRKLAISIVAQVEDLINLIAENCDDRSVRFEGNKARTRCAEARKDLDRVQMEVASMFDKSNSAGHRAPGDLRSTPEPSTD